MSWPFGKKRRGFGLFDDFGEDVFEKMFEDMEKMMQDMQSEPGTSAKKYGPFVYGVSMRSGPDGKPVVEHFGNVKPPSKELPSGEREPLVDVIEQKEKITVIAELPGVEKKDVKLKVVGKQLSIGVNTPERKYSKSIQLPAEVKKDSAKATYKNGVLEVQLDRKEPKKEDSAEIKVE